MAQQIPLDPSLQTALDGDDPVHEIAPDVAYRRLAIVNVAFYGLPNASEWVLIDAGLPGTKGLIQSAAKSRFGDHPPAAIILTHGHFDHVGVLEALAKEWEVPIYAHVHEHPYLNGTASYPPADPTVGGGLMSLLSPLFPTSPVNVKRYLHALPEDGTVPHMSGFRWIHVPGHAAGQVALWREADSVLISADAFITTAQESAYAAVTQEPELHGPPMYFTHDWQAARDSVRTLAALRPSVVVSGHGHAMRGPGLLPALDRLAAEFNEIAVPKHGRYVEHPKRAEDGSAYRL